MKSFSCIDKVITFEHFLQSNNELQLKDIPYTVIMIGVYSPTFFLPLSYTKNGNM